MRRFLFLAFIILVGFSVNDVQKEAITLNWFSGERIKSLEFEGIELYFEDADFPIVGSNLPFFSKLFPLQNEFQEYRFALENVVFEELMPEMRLSFENELKKEIEIKTSKLKSGDSRKVRVEVSTIVKRDDKVYLLKSFELKRVPVQNKSVVSEPLTWESESVLKTGKWGKIKVPEKGIYKISYSRLKEWGFSNPANVNLFGSGGIHLSENPGTVEFDDLKQCAVWHDQNGGEDCLFFYAPGCVEWKLNTTGNNFEHSLSNYYSSGFFFLSEEVGSTKNVGLLPEVQGAATHQLSSFDEYKLYEQELENLLPDGSGKQWFGKKFRKGESENIEFLLEGLDSSEKIRIKVNAAARSAQPSQMMVTAGEEELGILRFTQVNTTSNVSLYAHERNDIFEYSTQNSSETVSFNYLASLESSEAWIDYVELFYRRKLQVTDEALFFRDGNSIGENNIVEFSISGVSSDTKLFDVTDLNNVSEIQMQVAGNTAKAICSATSLKEYTVFNSGGSFPEPEWVGEVENQNLHGLTSAEYLIITHPNFLSSANELADFHRSYDGMNVEVVTTDQVYNEFSSGRKDATGIRNFIKRVYDSGSGLKYVLLFGDGSFDNKSIDPESNSFIPTFQSENSLNPLFSFVTDDYFVMLDADESVYHGAIDLGIGRIPASTAFEAQLVVDKIKNYYSPEALGDWRNIICFIGDDEDGGIHMTQSEQLADKINDSYREFVTNKIYFDAYQQESQAGVERYPDVTSAINQRVKDGVLVLNYVGHANDRFLSDERVLDVSNINSWSNFNNLPIFVTATCEFSRFDANETSAGEYVLLNANGGGIGLFSTTRVVESSSNFVLSRSFYNYIFEKNENGEHYRMGDIIRLAKTNISNSTNKRNFSLLADPALKLTYPEHKVITTSINQKDATGVPDTIGALEKITVTGYVADFRGNKLNNFSGEITPTVYDKEVVMETLGNGGVEPVQFKTQENIIYKGLANVTNGEFSFSFVVPKDISYNLGEGKIIYYADNNEEDAHGAFENFVIGGSGSQIVDNSGPEIQLYMDSRDFVSGDKTSTNPTLLAYLSDENGINTVGTGIGHDIVAILDDDYSNVYVLNSYYKADVDDYTSGVVEFPFKNLSSGNHTLRLKAWDVANNSSEVEIEFEVSGDFFIREVSNYPNPVTDYTFFTFEHNQSDATLNAIIEVFDISGRRVQLFSEEVGSNGLTSNPVRWELSETQTKLRNGIYIFRITAQNEDGVIASKSGKIVVAQ